MQTSSALAKLPSALLKTNKTPARSLVFIRAVSTTAPVLKPAEAPVRRKSTVAALLQDEGDYDRNMRDDFLPWLRKETMHTGSTLVQAMLP